MSSQHLSFADSHTTQDKYSVGTPTTSGGAGASGPSEQFMLNEGVRYSPNYNNGSGNSKHGSAQSSNKSNKSIQNPINQQIIAATGSCQGSFHSLQNTGVTTSSGTSAGASGGAGIGTPLHDPQLYHLQHYNTQQNGSSRNSPSSHQGSSSSPHTLQQQQQQQHGGVSYRHSHPTESTFSGRSGSVRSRVNSDSKCHTNLTATESNKSNTSSSDIKDRDRTKCTAATSYRNNNNNNLTKSNNNCSSHLSASDQSNNPLRHIIRQNSKNIEFNRQLSAPTENQNSYNSVYNLHHGIFNSNNNSSSHHYHSGSPNTNSLNRTKKKRSFKLNGR